MWRQITDWYGNSTLIHYASLLALSAGFGFALLRGMMLCVRMWRSLSGKSPFWRLPIPLLYAKILTEFRGISLVLVSLIGFVSGSAVTYSFMNTLRLDNSRGPYKIRIENKIDANHWLVYKLDEQERPVGDKWTLAICPYEQNPAFDIGCIYRVKFELSSTNRGYCDT